MKIISLSLIINCFVLLTFSQEVIYTATQQPLKKNYFNNIIGSNENYFYTRVYYTFDYVFEKYSCTTGELGGKIEGEGNFLDGTPKYDFENFFVNDKGLHFFGTNYNKKQKDFNFYLFRKDFENKSNILVATANYKIPDGFEKDIKHYFITSKLKNKYLLVIQCYNKKAKEIYLDFQLFDSDFNKLYSQDNTYGNTRAILNIAVDNEGSIYYGKVSIDEQYTVISYDANRDFDYWENSVDNSVLKKDEIIIDIKFISNTNNDLIITGFILNDEKKIRALWYQKLDGFSKELLLSKQIELSEKFKNDFIEEKKSMEYNFTENKYFTTESNHLYLLSEEHYITTSQHSKTAIISYTHNYGDILFFDIDDSGNLVHAGGIKKKNKVISNRDISSLPVEMRNPGLSSSFIKGDEVFILFPDDDKLSSFHYNAECDSLKESEFELSIQEDWLLNTKDFRINNSNLIVPMRNDANEYKNSINKLF